nr:uncharacterized protein LOC113808994 [Penaeus vannamei]
MSLPAAASVRPRSPPRNSEPYGGEGAGVASGAGRCCGESRRSTGSPRARRPTRPCKLRRAACCRWRRAGSSSCTTTTATTASCSRPGPSSSRLRQMDGRPPSSPEMTHGFQPDPTVEEPPMPQLWAVLRAEMEAEAVSQEEVRRGVEETAQVREARAREEEDPALVTHIFDIHRNETVQFILRQRQYDEAHREETLRKKREEREGKVDIIAPYIPLLTVGIQASLHSFVYL